MTKIIDWYSSQTVSLLTIALRNNHLIAGTTDTILGLLAPLTPEGFDLLNKVKGRQEKPYLILISDIQKLSLFVDRYPSYLQPVLDECWPGPLTILFNARRDLPSYLVSKRNTVAIRIPKHDGLQALLAHFDGLFSTSANAAHQPVAHTIAELNTTIKEAVAYCVTQQGYTTTVVPSTIIDCTADRVVVVREGVYSTNYLSKISGISFTQ